MTAVVTVGTVVCLRSIRAFKRKQLPMAKALHSCTDDQANHSIRILQN